MATDGTSGPGQRAGAACCGRSQLASRRRAPRAARRRPAVSQAACARWSSPSAWACAHREITSASSATASRSPSTARRVEAHGVELVAEQQRQVGVVGLAPPRRRRGSAGGSPRGSAPPAARTPRAGRRRAGRRPPPGPDPGPARAGASGPTRAAGRPRGHAARLVAARSLMRIAAKAPAAASIVRSTCSGPWASEGNQASNWDGGGYTPRASSARHQAACASRSQAASAGVVAHRLGAEEDGDQPGDADHLHRLGARRLAQAARPASRWWAAGARRRRRRACQRGQPGGHGERVPRQRAGLVDVAGRGDALHQLARAPRRRRRAARRRPPCPSPSGRAPRRQAPARLRGRRESPLITSSKTSSAPLSSAALAQGAPGSRPRAEPVPCWPGTGSARIAASSCSATAARRAASVVPGDNDRLRGGLRRHARAGGDALRGQPDPASASSPSTCPW